MPEPSSPEEPLTSDLVEFLVETEPRSTSTSSTTFPRHPKGLDLDSLSPRGAAIKLLLADEIADGHNLNTLASELGLSQSSASALIAELRNELELQTGPVSPLSAEEFQALKDSIEADGVKVPVIIGQHMLIDGRHRWRASIELGIKEIPAIFLDGLAEDQERDLCIALNVVRRQLTREQRQALIRAELMRDPTRSSRRIAKLCGVTHPAVEAVRAKIRQEAEVEPSDDDVDAAQDFVNKNVVTTEKRIGTNGTVREYPVNSRPDLVERPVAYVNCGRCGQRHALVKDGGTYRLETT